MTALLPKARFISRENRTWPVYLVKASYTLQGLVEWKRSTGANVPDVVLGTADDTAEVTRVLGYAKSRAAQYAGTDNVVDVVFPSTQLVCEDTISMSDLRNVRFSGAGTIAHTLGPDGQGGYGDPSAANTDALGNANDTTYRNRSHFEFFRGERIIFNKGFRISGPHPETGRAISLAYVLEAQHAIWFKSVGKNLPEGEGWGLWLDEANLDHVWGDFLSMTSESPYGPNSERIWARGGEYRRNGREAAYPAGVMNFRWYDTQALRLASQFIHGESGSGKVITQGDIIVRNVYWTEGRDALHMTGGARVIGIEVTDCYHAGRSFNAYFDPNGRIKLVDGQWVDATLAEGGEGRIQYVTLERNGHRDPPDGGHFILFRHVDHAVVRHNYGQLRSIYTEDEQITSSDSTDIVVGPNDYWGYRV